MLCMVVAASAARPLYCKTSGRAALAATTMQSMGYLHVVSIAGGIEAWVQAGMPVVKPVQPLFE